MRCRSYDEGQAGGWEIWNSFSEGEARKGIKRDRGKNNIKTV